MEEGEPDPNEIFADLGMLIVEGRKPEESIKGRREGEHCPPVIGIPLHQCIPGNTKCHTMSMVRSHINYMFQNNIPMSIEVLQYPDCCRNSLEEVAIGAEASLNPDQPCLLLEQWIIQVLPRRSVQYQQSSRMLLQAIRSYLHFSQLSSWLSMNNGKEPKNITYRVSAPGEAFPANFVKTPEVHSFPAVNITKSSCIRVSVAYLPRQQKIPMVSCAVGHKKMKFSGQPFHDKEIPFNMSEMRHLSEHSRQPKFKRGTGRKCGDKRTKLERFNSDNNVGHCSRQLDTELYKNAKKHKRKGNQPTNASKKCNVDRTQQYDDTRKDIVTKEDFKTSVSIPENRNFFTDNKNVCITNTKIDTSSEGLPCRESANQLNKDISKEYESPDEKRNRLEERIDRGIYFIADDKKDTLNDSLPSQSSIINSNKISLGLNNSVQCDSLNVDEHKNVSHSSTCLTGKPMSVESSSYLKERSSSESSDRLENQSKLQTSQPAEFKSNTFITSVQNLVSDIRTKLDFDSDDEMSPSVSSTVSAIKRDQISNVASQKPSMKRGNKASGQGFLADPQTSLQSVPQEKNKQERNSRFIPVFSKSKSLFKSVIQREPAPTPKAANENTFEKSISWSSPEKKRPHSRSIDSSGSYIFNPRTGLPLNSSPAPMRKTKESTDDSSLSSRQAVTLKSSTSCNDLGRTLTPMNQSTRVLSTSAPASTSCLLGSFEESVLNGRMEPLGTIEGFTAEIGASGRFCPSHVRLPVTAFFYSVTDDDQPSSYMGYINLESVGKRGYHVPAQGTIQVMLFNPNGTVVKIFVVRYNLSDMPPNCQTFCRQRVFYMPSNANINDECEKELRYLLHLRFQSSKSGRIYLHTDIRMIFARHRPDLESGIATYELRSFTEMPSNPRFSPKK
ncbi:atos homolog protein A-like [Antedon mediterranea]|uniref:atos homolog protein A-like n=1 Tax=Antedon mediterranea TaxID=105859 RepID=UPI003AF9448E